MQRGKFSSQVISETQPRATRTERLRQQSIIRQQQQDEQALQILSERLRNLSYEDYKKEYAKIDPRYKKYFKSPQEIESTPEYQEYAMKKAEYEEKVRQAQKEENEWRYAENMVRNYPQIVPVLPESIRRKAEELQRGGMMSWDQIESQKKEYQKALQNLIDQGYKPVIETKNNYSQIVGFNVDNFILKPEEVYPYVEGQRQIEIIEFQKKYPQEKLKFNEQGDIIGVESGAFKGSYDIGEYNKMVEEYNKNVKTPEQTYQEWLQMDSKRPIYLDFTSTDVSKFGYVTRGTSGTRTTEAMPIYPIKIQEEKPSKVKEFLRGFGEYEIPIFIGQSGTKIKPSQILNPLSDAFGSKQEQLQEVIDKRTGTKEQVEKEMMEEYQTRFERKYMKDILLNEKDFDEAVKEFKNSDQALIVQQKYQNILKERQATKPFKFPSKEEFGIVGLEIGKKVIDITPRSIGESAVATALVYGGYKTLTAIPPSVLTVANIGIGAVEFGKIASGKTSGVEKASSVVNLGLTGGMLGYQAYKYFRSPVVEEVLIKTGKRNLYSTSTIGKDVYYIKGEKTVNKVIYGKQKLSQQVTIGKRTEVYSKGADLMNKYLKFHIKPIYYGVPNMQTRTIYGTNVFTGQRYIIRESAYQKAMKRLMEYDYTKSQAQATLRYTAPKISEQWLKRGILHIKGTTAQGEFIYGTKKPVIDIDKALGIKTRGGKTVGELYNLKRKIIFVGDKELVLENARRIKGVSGKTITEMENYQGLTKAKTSQVYEKGYEYITGKGKNAVYRYPVQYQEMEGISHKKLIQLITRKGRMINVNYITNSPDIDIHFATLYKKYYLSPYGSGKRVLIRGKTYPTRVQLDEVGDKVQKMATSTAQSPTMVDLRGQLKLPPKSTRLQTGTQVIKTGTKLKDVTKSIPMTQYGSANTRLKEKMVMSEIDRLNLKTELMIKLDERGTLKNADSQRANQKLKEGLKEGQPQRTRLDLIQPVPPRLDLGTPPRNPPRLPRMPMPPVKPRLFFGNDKNLLKKIEAKLKLKKINLFASMPDFTSRIVGLAPKKVSIKEALRDMQRISTGLEIRTGAMLNEKQLLKGIMV